MSSGANGPESWINAASVDAKPVRWLWYPYLAAENINIIAGMGGEGKGLVAMHLAAAVTGGTGWPLSSETTAPGGVLWCETEDAVDATLIPRMQAAGVERSKVFLLDAQQLQALSPAALKREIIERGIKLIVLSPMTSFLQRADINNETDVRSALGNLAEAIQGTECAILGICHANKKADLSAIERILGSVAFVNFCRSVLLVAPDRENPTKKRLVHAKHNLSPRGGDLLYEPVHVGGDHRDQYVRVDWQAPDHDVDPASLFDRASPGDGRVNKQPNAGTWLRVFLAGKGRVPQQDVLAAAEDAGHKPDTIRKAHQRGIQFRTEQVGFQGHHVWWLDEG